MCILDQEKLYAKKNHGLEFQDTVPLSLSGTFFNRQKCRPSNGRISVRWDHGFDPQHGGYLGVHLDPLDWPRNVLLSGWV